MRLAAAKVRRLRHGLTVLYALATTAGLLAFVLFAARTNEQLEHSSLDYQLAARLLSNVDQVDWDDEDGKLDLEDLTPARLRAGCPSVALLVVYGSRIVSGADSPCAHALAQDVIAVAARSIASEEPARAESRDNRGNPVLLVACYSYSHSDLDEPDSAVVAVGDPRLGMDAQAHLVTWMLILSAGLVAVSVILGYVVSGRSARRAIGALEQQEALLADAAHDLRTPVATLRTLAESTLAQPARNEDLLRRTAETAERLGTLVDGLLTRARMSGGTLRLHLQPLRLDQLVEVVIEDAAAGEHHVVLRARPSVVTADADLVRRAVANLVDNALRHGHQPGLAAHVEVTVAAGIVTISDAGPGIPPEQASVIFERFASGAGSTGLGLSIAHWVAQAHGGSLTLTRAPGGGARFDLRLTPEPRRSFGRAVRALLTRGLSR